MNRHLITALFACLFAYSPLNASRPASSADEAAQLRAAIQASLKESKADIELEQAIARSKQEFETKEKGEDDQFRKAIELSREEADAAMAVREKKESADIGAREQSGMIEAFQALEAILKGTPQSDARDRKLQEIKQIIKELLAKPSTIATLQRLQKDLSMHNIDTYTALGIHFRNNTSEWKLAYILNKIGYEIDRLKGIPGISFRDYYKKHKANVDAQVASGILSLWNANLIDLTDFDEKHVPGLNALRGLYLNDNKLKRIPDSIGELRALRVLYLGNNYLSDLAPTLGSLPLTRLRISGNKFIAIPQVVGHLHALQDLYAGNNQIAVIPDWIGDLVNLTDLDLSDNKIVALPDSMSKLHALQGLFLSNNRIIEIPDWVGDFDQLFVLDLVDNKISLLPETIASEDKPSKLVSLHNLYLSGNDFVTPPLGLNKLPALESLDLRNNPMTYTDAELRKILELRPDINFLYKTPEQEKVEQALINGIKAGDADAVQKAFTTIMAGRILIGPQPADEKIDISKIRDADGNNLLQLLLKTLVAKVGEIKSKKKLNAKTKAEAIFAIETRYTKIYMTLTQFGGPKVYDMIIARNKAGQDLFQAASGSLNPESFFVQTLREYRYKPTPAGQHAPRYKIMKRHLKEEDEAERAVKERLEQKKKLEGEEKKVEAAKSPKQPESMATE